MSKRIVAITACPTGVAHTFMAAEALEEEAKKRGYWIKIETRGSVALKTRHRRNPHRQILLLLLPISNSIYPALPVKNFIKPALVQH